MEDQILYVDSMEEVSSGENPFKKLLKKEQRLIARLHEEQEAEVIAQERFQQAQKRLQRRRKRLERIQGKLVHVREQLAELQITDQQSVYSENELVIVPTQESNTHHNFEEVALVQPEQETTSHTTFTYEPIEAIVESEPGTTSEVRSAGALLAPELEASSSVHLSSIHFESAPEAEAPSSNTEVDFSNTSESEHEAAQEIEASSPSPIESTIPTTFDQEPIVSFDTTAVEPEAEIKEEVDLSSEAIIERKPTKPLRLEQPGLPVSETHSPDVQSSKEAWIAAESAMQNARNAAHGLAASISFLSQTDGISDEFMEELLRKQADANKELLQAQDAARAAYERFVQTQRDAESSASRPVDIATNPAEDHSQQKQENASLPPAEENGVDQTAKLHAVRLYKEW